MNVNSKVRKIVAKMVSNAQESRELNRMLYDELDKLNVDTNSQDFINAFSYIEGDCDASLFIDYLEKDI
ncbi:MAG: hypothetical protein J6R47_00205 [Acholeplasmatales bacterium]|nr:hypothetical protein [Acholeplasmatales bacterium]